MLKKTIFSGVLAFPYNNENICRNLYIVVIIYTTDSEEMRRLSNLQLEVKEVCDINDNEVVKKPTVEKDVNEDTVDEVEETRDQEMNDRNAEADNDVIVKEIRESSTKIRESLLVLQSTVTKGSH